MGIKVYLADGTEHDYSDEEISGYFKDNTWPGYKESDSPVINIKNEEGIFSTPFTKENLRSSLDSGYQLEDSKEAADRAYKEQAETVPFAQAKAAGRGLLRGATFGADAVIAKAFGHPEWGKEQQGAAEAFPITSFLTETAGMVGPAIATSGTGLASQALAKGTLAGLSETAALKLGAGAASAWWKRAAVRGAEGAAISMVTSANEAYVQDTELRAEEVLGNGMLGLVLGGGTETAISGLIGVSKLVQKGVKNLAEVNMNKFIKLQSKATDIPEEYIEKVYNNKESVRIHKDQDEIISNNAVKLSASETAIQQGSSDVTVDYYRNAADYLKKNFGTENTSRMMDTSLETLQGIGIDLRFPGLKRAAEAIDLSKEMGKAVDAGDTGLIDELFTSYDKLYQEINKITDDMFTKKVSEIKIPSVSKDLGATADSVRVKATLDASGIDIEAMRGNNLFMDLLSAEDKIDLKASMFGSLNKFNSELKAGRRTLEAQRKAGNTLTNSQLASIEVISSSIGRIDDILTNPSFFGKAGELHASVNQVTRQYMKDEFENKLLPNIWAATELKGGYPKWTAKDPSVVSMLRNSLKPEGKQSMDAYTNHVLLRENQIKAMREVVDDPKFTKKADSWLKSSESHKEISAKMVDDLNTIKIINHVYQNSDTKMMAGIGMFSFWWSITGSPMGGMAGMMATSLLESPKMMNSYLKFIDKIKENQAVNFVGKTAAMVGKLTKKTIDITEKGISGSKKIAKLPLAAYNAEDAGSLEENLSRITPETIKAALKDNVPAFSMIDPDFTEAVQKKISETVALIKSKIPTKNAPDMLNNKKTKIDLLAKYKIEKLTNIAYDSNYIFELIKSNKIDKESMEFFAEVYPRHYKSIIDEVTKNITNIPNTSNNRRLVSIILGVPTTTSQKLVSVIQKNYEPPKSPGEARPKISESATKRNVQNMRTSVDNNTANRSST